MLVKVFKETSSLADAAADQASGTIRRAIAERERARIILATGTSQFAFLDALTRTTDLDWSKVEAFHLDEYIGIPATHPASFRRILQERVVQKTGIRYFYPIEGDSVDLPAEIRAVSQLLKSAPIDLAFIGIGENGHVAFNDPPADFDAEEPYKIVELDEACRRQQMGEGWFPSLSQVPTRAVSMTVRQIMKSQQIISVVPDRRKAQAVKNTLESKISPRIPASILRQHPDVTLYLDQDSASLLGGAIRDGLEQKSEVTVES